MSHPAISSSRPLVFAHRGGSALAPENTLPAFANALALGADGVELDVQLTKDGVVIVHHDSHLDRTTDATGPVQDRTAAELGHVDAGARFAGDGSYRFRGRGIAVPTFADVLAQCSGTRLIVELKGASPVLARATLAEVRRAAALDRVCIGGFDGAGLRLVRASEPTMATSASREEVRWALYRSWIGLRPCRPAYQAFQVPEHYGRTTVVSPRFVNAVHRAGIVVQVWTVDQPDDMIRLLDWGVDGLITDRPDVAVPLVRRWVESQHAGIGFS